MPGVKAAPAVRNEDD